MSIYKIGDILPKVAERSGDPRVMEATYILQRINNSIEMIFGKNAAGEVSAIKYKEGVLTLGVRSSAWAQELKYKESSLKLFVSEQLQQVSIRKISFKVVSSF